jgi:hypothetical protein
MRQFSTEMLERIEIELTRVRKMAEHADDLKYPLIFKRGRKPRRRLRFGVEVLRIARLAAAAWPLAYWE